MRDVPHAAARTLAAVMSFLLLVGPARAEDNTESKPAATRLGPGDSVTILALNCDEISKAWRIGTTGDITLPMLGRMHVAGLTIEELEQALTTELRKFLLDPQVTVFVSERESSPVFVTGAVEKPGRYQLSPARTLFDAIVMAGGPAKEVGPRMTVKRSIERGGMNIPGATTDRDGGYATVTFDLKDVMSGSSAAALLELKPYDVVIVAGAEPHRVVHVSGEVARPGYVELVTQDSVSLMKVIAVAGGLTRTAAGGKTMIMHVNESGVQTSTAFIDIRKIMSGKAKDLELIPGDIVVVPSSQLKTFTQAATGAAMSSGIYSAMYALGRF